VLTPEDEAALLQVVASVRSCYSAGDERAVGFVATESLREAGAQTVALLPMAPGPGQSALVAVFDERPHRLDTDRVELLELLASAASSRLQTLSSMTELRRRATEDTLTGAGNRLAFGEALQRWEREALRGALAVVDVDGFKRVNDTWGHGEGDRLLVELTESLRQAIRPGDAVFRLGGDEFAVLLPGVLDDAEGVADRLVLAAGPTLASRGASISVGVAPLLPGSPAAEAVRLADRALYAAKRRRPAVHGRRAAAVECAPQVR
jgi:diguanylate cyclase (GGDEF)-like protein